MITLAQFQVSEMSPGLLQDFLDGYIKEHRVVVSASIVVNASIVRD